MRISEATYSAVSGREDSFRTDPAEFHLLASSDIHRFVAFLPFWSKSLKSLKPTSYERNPKTLGQHLKKRRVELGLYQRHMRGMFDLDKDTYLNWEHDRCYPSMWHWPKIIKLLGYDPNPSPQSLGEQLVAYRRRRGLSRKALATILSVDEGTLWRWEIDKRQPKLPEHVRAVSRLQLDAEFSISPIGDAPT